MNNVLSKNFNKKQVSIKIDKHSFACMFYASFIYIFDNVAFKTMQTALLLKYIFYSRI